MTDPAKDVPMKAEDEPEHWFVRKSTILWIWIVSIVILAIVTLLDFVIHKHSHFELEDGFGFGSWYGFVACLALVVGAKLLGMILKRPDGYYDD